VNLLLILLRIWIKEYDGGVVCVFWGLQLLLLIRLLSPLLILLHRDNFFVVEREKH
jgi:hypothetical protein